MLDFYKMFTENFVKEKNNTVENWFFAGNMFIELNYIYTYIYIYIYIYISVFVPTCVRLHVLVCLHRGWEYAYNVCVFMVVWVCLYASVNKGVWYVWACIKRENMCAYVRAFVCVCEYVYIGRQCVFVWVDKGCKCVGLGRNFSCKQVSLKIIQDDYILKCL